jgi:tetratricopeptide (TPR) repeat protein
LVLCLAAGDAAAATRALSVAGGSCRDTDLVQAQAAFSDVLKSRLQADAVDARALLAERKPAAPLSLEELQRLVEVANSRFYAGQHEAALAQVKEAVEALERSPPSARNWKLLAAGRVLQSLILKATGKKEPATEAFRRVLRVAPSHVLDANEYSPSTVAAFEAVRKELKAAKKSAVSIVSQPPGAEVFLDGAPVGTTPFSGALPPGSYSVSILGAAGSSFPRVLKVERTAASIEVDLAFEASLAPQLPLCVEGAGEEAVLRAVKLGAVAGAELVVLLRLSPRPGQPSWLEAALFDVSRGTQARAGGMRLVTSRQQGALDALAAYVLTGQLHDLVTVDGPVARTDSVAPTAPAAPAAVVADAPAAPAARAAPVEARPPSAAASQSSAPRPPLGRILGFSLMGAGILTGAAGAVVFGEGAKNRDLLYALSDPQGNIPPEGAQGHDEAAALAPKVEGNTAGAVALLAGGGALLVTGIILTAALPPPKDQTPTVAVVFSPAGAALSVSGSF